MWRTQISILQLTFMSLFFLCACGRLHPFTPINRPKFCGNLSHLEDGFTDGHGFGTDNGSCAAFRVCDTVAVPASFLFRLLTGRNKVVKFSIPSVQPLAPAPGGCVYVRVRICTSHEQIAI